MRERQRAEGGFTLIELMMALVIFSVAVAGILSVAVSLTQGFREQRLAINAQDAVRAPLDMIADALRQASPGVQDPTRVYDPNICTTGAISMTNSTSGADTLDIVYAAGGIVTSTTEAITDASTTMVIAEDKNLVSGDYVLITNFATGHVIKLSNATSGTTLGLTSTASCSDPAIDTFSYPVGAIVIRVQHARFTVANDSSNGNMPTLWMDADSTGVDYAPEPLAEGIEDMQVALGVDADADGAVSDTSSSTDEWRYNDAADTTVVVTDIVRAARVTLIARTTSGEHGNQNTYSKPTAEDRTGASTPDQYRRRVLKQIVDIRNVTGSP